MGRTLDLRLRFPGTWTIFKGGMVLCVAALVLLPSSPVFQPVPGRDSGAFLYTAHGILEGKMPYLDLWDHKGPVLFLLNALGLVIPLPSWWGVWLIRVVILTVSLKAGHAVLKSAFGASAAFLSSATWLCFFSVFLGDGNFAEEYALFFGFFSVWLLFGHSFPRRSPLTYALLGAATSMVFLLRQNLVGTLSILALIVVFASKLDPETSMARTRIVPLIAGAIVSPVFLLLWLYTNGALRAWWECTFLYNRIYVGGSVKTNIAATFEIVAGNPILSVCLFLFLVALTVACIHLSAGIKRQLIRELLWFAVVALPVEVIAASLSGLGYRHYFLPWLLPGSVLVAHFFARLGVSIENNDLRPVRLILLFSPIILATAWLTYPTWLNGFDFSDLDRQRLILSDYLIDSTSVDETVLIWGAESGVLVKAQRRSPEPYFYSYPLFKSGFEPYRRFDEFLENLKENPPRLIVDTAATNPAVPPIALGPFNSREVRDPSYTAGGLDPFRTFVENHYRPSAIVGEPRSWIVYELRAHN